FLPCTFAIRPCSPGSPEKRMAQSSDDPPVCIAAALPRCLRLAARCLRGCAGRCLRAARDPYSSEAKAAVGGRRTPPASRAPCVVCVQHVSVKECRRLGGPRPPTRQPPYI